jgi:hypothetical protein
VRISNPPSNPELLDALAAKLTESNYDFKRFVRDLCASRTYQLSTRANDSNAGDDRNFSHAQVRRLRAEVLLDCVNEVAGTQEKFKGLPKGARAVQIADGNETSYFLTTFGRATRESVCTCEVKVEPNLSQALHSAQWQHCPTKNSIGRSDSAMSRGEESSLRKSSKNSTCVAYRDRPPRRSRKNCNAFSPMRPNLRRSSRICSGL